MMRIALLSDIHGNAVALDAVLADVEAKGGADAYWVLGDLVAIGPDPAGVLARLTRLADVRFIRGNTDRYVVSGDRPPPTFAKAQTDARLLRALVEVAGTFAWTQGVLTATGWLDWLAGLPVEMREVLPNGVRFLGVHAAPGLDDGSGIQPEMDDEKVNEILHGCEADLICVGHTHRPFNRQVGRWHVVNLGSVSNPPARELRASYVMLKAGASGYGVEL